MEAPQVKKTIRKTIRWARLERRDMKKLCATIAENIQFMSEQIKRQEENQRVLQESHPEISNEIGLAKNGIEETKKDVEKMSEEAHEMLGDLHDHIAMLQALLDESEV